MVPQCVLRVVSWERSAPNVLADGKLLENEALRLRRTGGADKSGPT